MMKRRTGFTLIEVMVTLAIIGITAGIAVPLVQINSQRAKEAELRRALRDIRTAIDAYKQASDEGRIARSADASGFHRHCKTCTAEWKIKKSPQTKIFFLRRLPRDPMAPDSITDNACHRGERSYKTRQTTPSRETTCTTSSRDHPKKGLNGVPYRQW